MLELAAVRQASEGRVVVDLERFAVAPGAMIAIVGHNGSGKSTLLRLLALLERPAAGEVRWDGAVVSSPRVRPRAAARRRITLVEQRPVLLRGTVRANIGFGLKVRGQRGGEAEKTVTVVAERLGITGLLERRRHELSDGEVQRVAVARALAVAPDVLLLDEPVSSADRAAAQALHGPLAEERRARGLAILAVPPTDIFVSTEPLVSSARNVFTGQVTRLVRPRPGVVHVAADVGVELIAVITEEAARDLALAPGSRVTFAFKASAVRVF